MSFERVTMPSATERWRLDGPAGAGLDVLVAAAINAGLTVEPITAGRSYRLDGDQALIAEIAAALADIQGFTLTTENPPADAVHLSAVVQPRHPWRRTTIVHGPSNAAVWIARAVDAGLQVRPLGTWRFSVTGPTHTQLRWMADVQRIDAAAVLEQWHLTAEQAAEEDQGASINVTVPVRVALPDRRRETTKIKRNDDGNIVEVEQVEVDVEEGNP